MNTAVDTPTREDILAAFSTFVSQRPGLEPGNYFSTWSGAEGRRAYRADARAITADLNDARDLLAAVERSSVTADDILAVLRDTGRLTWDDSRGALDYCTGQYFPTEYRRAACRALSTALWHHWKGEDGTSDSVVTEARRTFRRRSVLRYFV